MTDNTSDPLPLGTVEAVGKAAAFNQSTVLHDPRPHSQRLGDGMFNAAADYASAYKQRHPEASGQITRIATFAFKPKPTGYVEYVDSLIASWLSGADTETNTATVKRIRDRFPNHSFAGSLLNKPLSKGRCEKIAANAAQLGFRINTRKYDTLSKIKAAAKANALSARIDNELLIRTTISGNSLMAHGRDYKIETHGKGKRLNFRHNGKQIHLRVDHLEAFAEWLAGDGTGDGTGDCSSNLLLQSIEICSQETGKPAETRQDALKAFDIYTDADNLAPELPEICSQETSTPAETLDSNGGIVSGNMLPNELGAHPEPTMTERIAALSARYTADDATAYPADYDPLCHD